MLMGSRKPTLSPHPGEISCCQQSRLDNVSRGKWGVKGERSGESKDKMVLEL